VSRSAPDPRRLLGPDPGPVPDWSARLLERGGPAVPEYGSAEWAALPDDSAAKVAATVAAAEAWRRSTHPDVVRDRLELELAAGRQAVAAEAAVAWRNFAAPYAAPRPSYAQLCDLRGEPDRAARARASEAERGLFVSPPLQGSTPDPPPAAGRARDTARVASPAAVGR
jgi:hypothetical protein